MDQKGSNRKDFEQLNHKIDLLAMSNSRLVSQVSELLSQNKELQKSSQAQAKEFTKATSKGISMVASGNGIGTAPTTTAAVVETLTIACDMNLLRFNL